MDSKCCVCKKELTEENSNGKECHNCGEICIDCDGFYCECCDDYYCANCQSEARSCNKSDYYFCEKCAGDIKCAVCSVDILCPYTSTKCRCGATICNRCYAKLFIENTKNDCCEGVPAAKKEDKL